MTGPLGHLGHLSRYMSLLQKIAIVVGALLTVSAAVFLLWPRSATSGLELVDFPDDTDIVSITASLNENESGYFHSATPEFVVAPEHAVKLLATFRPTEKCDYPPAWDQDTLARLIIKTKSGEAHLVTIPFSGKNKLCFTFDGVRCVRGGQYKPVYVGEREMDSIWTPECMIVAQIIRELFEQQANGNNSDRYSELLEDLERSAGLRPPKINE